MNKLLLLALVVLMPIGLQAQNEDQKKDKSQQNVIYKTVPKKNFFIRDKIIVQNKSPYYILQVVVALENANGEFQPLGSSTYIAPNETYELAAFKNNSLKKLKGQVIAIKAKGAKIVFGDSNQTNVWTPYGSVGVRHKELDPELVNNIKDSDITYDFDAKLFEANHDLYIELYNSGKQGVMDF
jgi:hypothetical protein